MIDSGEHDVVGTVESIDDEGEERREAEREMAWTKGLGAGLRD